MPGPGLTMSLVRALFCRRNASLPLRSSEFLNTSLLITSTVNLPLTFNATAERWVHVAVPSDLGRLRIKKRLPKFEILLEAIYIVLEHIFEPHFSFHSHGFRPGRGPKTAALEIQRSWKGISWMLEFKVSECFESLNQKLLFEVLEARIKDELFTTLLRGILNVARCSTNKPSQLFGQGPTPHNSHLYPLLCNIYLDLLDREVQHIKQQYQTPRGLHEEEQETDNLEDIDSPRPKKRLKPKIKAGIPDDANLDKFIVVKYIRHGSDILFGIVGPKEITSKVGKRVTYFIVSKLLLKFEENNFLHATSPLKFLGEYPVGGVVNPKAERQAAKAMEKKRRIKHRLKMQYMHKRIAWENEVKHLAFKASHRCMNKAVATLVKVKKTHDLESIVHLLGKGYEYTDF